EALPKEQRVSQRSGRAWPNILSLQPPAAITPRRSLQRLHPSGNLSAAQSIPATSSMTQIAQIFSPKFRVVWTNGYGWLKHTFRNECDDGTGEARSLIATTISVIRRQSGRSPVPALARPRTVQ